MLIYSNICLHETNIWTWCAPRMTSVVLRAAVNEQLYVYSHTHTYSKAAGLQPELQTEQRWEEYKELLFFIYTCYQVGVQQTELLFWYLRILYGVMFSRAMLWLVSAQWVRRCVCSGAVRMYIVLHIYSMSIMRWLIHIISAYASQCMSSLLLKGVAFIASFIKMSRDELQM